MVKVIVFDFDGVIVPSEEIKADGYSLMFSEFGEAVPAEAVKSARKEFANAKGNRYDIIRSILARIGFEGSLDEGVEKYGERYSTIVRSRIADLAVEPSVREFLSVLSKKYPLYINSNNPDVALRDTLSSLDLSGYFKSVFGSSCTKLQNLRTIAEAEKVHPDRILFIGDGEGDWSAAREFGCRFVGVGTRLNDWKAGSAPFPLVSRVEDVITE